ncbi:hypothetical protein [Acidocella sp.]|uniref:hypothetical protein n=1 Tax=Acidocella sp. TaxID=50710 RepID=UPI003CFC19D2
MRNQTTPSFSPDGLGGNGVVVARDARTSGRSSHPAPTHRRAESSHDHNADFDNYDDGLVHGHFWAMSSTVR